MTDLSDSKQQLLLSTGEVAEMLDAHPSSIKRWASDGTLPCVTTSGGHRRFSLEDVRSFSSRTGVPFSFGALEEDLYPFVAAIQLPANELDRTLTSIFYRWFTTGKTDRAEWALTHLHKTRYTIGGLFDRILAPVLNELGTQWEQGLVSVATEHHVSQQVAEALYRLRPQAGSRPGRRPVAVCAGAENCLHFLPLLAARLILENQGWNVAFLGPAVPNEDLAEMVIAQRASLVCVSFAAPLGHGDVRRTVSALAQAYAKHPFRLAIGGKPAAGFDLPAGIQGGKTFTALTAFETWVLEQTLQIRMA